MPAPLPWSDATGLSESIKKWLRDIKQVVDSGTGAIPWASVSKATSNLTEIVTRLHSSLQSLQGGTTNEYYHLTAAQSAIVVAGLASGTYTPTLTNVANLDASTAYECQYIRLGNTVSVSGRVDADPTAGASTQLGISLPVASNIGATEDCAGTAFASGVASQGAAIRGDAANDRAEMIWVAVNTTNQPMYFHFQYQVI